MGEAVLRTEKVCREFQSGSEVVHALRDVCIEVPSSKLTVIRGRSGSGKTTLMNIIGALDTPTSGDVWFAQQSICGLTESERDQLRRLNMGFVFQSVALIGQMSAYENVEFALRLAGISATSRRVRGEECLSFVGLGKRMHHRPQELSAGEQQRVAIARAIAHNPKLLFVDEPTADLDSIMGLRVVMLFKDMAAQQGVTVVMTTHDPNMMELADTVYTLEDGMVTEHMQNAVPGSDT